MKKIVSTKEAPGAIGPYNQAIVETRSGLVFTAGQIALDPATGALAPGGAREQAHQVLKNLEAVLRAAGCGFEQVVKTTIFLKDINDFAAVNEAYAERFVKDFPARSTIEVARLPKDALVEMEMIASLP